MYCPSRALHENTKVRGPGVEAKGTILASTPGPLTFVSSWRAWFATTTWDRIDIEPT